MGGAVVHASTARFTQGGMGTVRVWPQHREERGKTKAIRPGLVGMRRAGGTPSA